MGCIHTSQTIPKKPKIIDLQLDYPRSPHYQGVFDKMNKSLANFFKYVFIQDYFQLILNPVYSNGFSSSDYEKLVELKILKNQVITNITLNNTDLYKKFLDFHSRLYEYILRAYKNYLKLSNQKKKNEKVHTVPQFVFLPFGILFTIGTYRTKIEVIFNLLANDNYVIVKENPQVRLFFFLLMYVCSGLLLLVMNSFRKEYSEIKEQLPLEEFEQCYQTYEVKDADRNSQEFLAKLFRKNSILTYEDFFDRITSPELSWILSTKGIRVYLEEHND